MKRIKSNSGKKFTLSKIKYKLFNKKELSEQSFSDLVDSLFPNYLLRGGIVYVLDGSYLWGCETRRIDYFSLDYPFNQPKDIREINILSIFDTNSEDCIKRFKNGFKKLKYDRTMTYEEKEEWLFGNSRKERSIKYD